MGIAFDKALGTNYLTGDQTSITLTTSQTVASGGFIVVGVGAFNWFDTVNVGTVTGGGLTWTVDKIQHPGGGADGYAIISAQAPSGLASSTAISVPFVNDTGVVAYPIIGGCSFTGVATSSPIDGTPLGVNGSGVTSWSSGSYAIAAGSVIVGGVYIDSGDSHNATAGTEVWDRNNGGGPSSAGVYRIESGAGSYAVSGSWTGSSGYTGAAVAYLSATGPPQTLRPDADVTTTGWTTTPLWSKIEETSADGTVITATAS